MKTRFTVEVTRDQKVALQIVHEVGELEVTFDAGDAMQLSYLLEAAAVEIQTRKMGTRPS